MIDCWIESRKSISFKIGYNQPKNGQPKLRLNYIPLIIIDCATHTKYSKQSLKALF